MSKGKSVVAAGHELTARRGRGNPARRRQRLRCGACRRVHDLRRRGGVLLARRRRLSHGAPGRERRLAPVRFLHRDAAASAGRRARSSSFRSTPISARPSRSSISGSDRAPRPAWCLACSPSTQALCRLPMKRLVEPAVRAAAQAFPLSAFQAYLFTVIAPILTASESVARIFAPNGKPMTAGETFRNDGACRMPRMARRGRRAALLRRRCRPGHRGAVAALRRPSHP